MRQRHAQRPLILDSNCRFKLSFETETAAWNKPPLAPALAEAPLHLHHQCGTCALIVKVSAAKTARFAQNDPDRARKRGVAPPSRGILRDRMRP